MAFTDSKQPVAEKVQQLPQWPSKHQDTSTADSVDAVKAYDFPSTWNVQTRCMRQPKLIVSMCIQCTIVHYILYVPISRYAIPGPSLESQSHLPSSLQTQDKDQSCWRDPLQWLSSSGRGQNHRIVIKYRGSCTELYRMSHTWGCVKRNNLLNSSNVMSENWFRPTRCENNMVYYERCTSWNLPVSDRSHCRTVLVKEWFPALWRSIVFLFSVKTRNRWSKSSGL